MTNIFFIHSQAPKQGRDSPRAKTNKETESQPGKYDLMLGLLCGNWRGGKFCNQGIYVLIATHEQ